MAETRRRMLLLSFPVLLLLFNVGPVAGDGFLDEINSDSVSSFLSSGSLDDAKKAISAASPDVKGAVEQFAASAGAKGDDAKSALESWAHSPGDDAAASPELAQAYKDASEEEKDGSSWKDWFKGKMSGMGYGSPAGAPAGSPEAAPGPAWGPSSSESLSPESSAADDQEAPAPAPSA